MFYNVELGKNSVKTYNDINIKTNVWIDNLELNKILDLLQNHHEEWSYLSTNTIERINYLIRINKWKADGWTKWYNEKYPKEHIEDEKQNLKIS